MSGSKRRIDIDPADMAAVRDAYEPVSRALLAVRHFDRSDEAKGRVRQATAAFVAAVERAMAGLEQPGRRRRRRRGAEVIDLCATFQARGGR